MPSINDVYGSGELLRAEDLPENVQVPVTIESVSHRKFDDGDKLEIRFVGKKKCLICNKTNAITISEMHGDDYSFWPGKQIAIYRTTTDFQGSRRLCVRVAPGAVMTAPQQQYAPPAQQFAAPPQPAQQFAAPPQQAAPQGGPSADF